MIDSETQRFIRQEIIRLTRDLVLTGATKDSKVITEGVDQLYANMANQPDRPLVHPYGFASKAPDGTLSQVLRQGDHIGNRVVVGHRDANRPTDIEQGESVQYSKTGYQVRVLNGKIQVGKGGVFETAVVGETLQAILVTILDYIIAHTHMGNLGYPTGTPMNKADFITVKTDEVAKGAFLAKDGGKF